MIRWGRLPFLCNACVVRALITRWFKLCDRFFFSALTASNLLIGQGGLSSIAIASGD